MIAVISIDYDEGDLSSYKGCVVRQHGEEVFRSFTDDLLDKAFVKDLLACVSYCSLSKLRVYWSSSVDTFQTERHEDYVSG